MSTASIKKIAGSLAGCVLGGLLVTSAYRVQGGVPSAMLPYGCALGAAIGLAVASNWVRLTIAGAAVGAISGLTIFQCLPCDGSNFIMPAFGAALGWLTSAVLRVVSRTSHPPAA